MEEKVLIQSEKYKTKKLALTLVLIGVLCSAILFSQHVIRELYYLNDRYDRCSEIYSKHEMLEFCSTKGKYGLCSDCEHYLDIVRYNTKTNYIAMYFYFPTEIIGIYLMPVTFLSLLTIGIHRYYNRYELTVTDKRIFGRVKRKQIDLPIDSVSAVSISGRNRINISTSSGYIRFSPIKNRDDIHTIISILLINRQERKAKEILSDKQKTRYNTADEIKKFKELLDDGIITQEEFDEKKKQLLRL